MATKGADIVCIHAIGWKLREAVGLLDGLPDGDDYRAVEDALNEALNAAESWAMESRSYRRSDPPPPVVADPKLITYLIGSGTKVPPPYPPPEHIDGREGR